MNEYTTEGIIAHFVKFKILLSVQAYFLKARSNFKVKAAVSKGVEITWDMDKINGDGIKKKTHCCVKVRYYLFRFIDFIFKLLFYFFPLIFVYFPLYVLSMKYHEFPTLGNQSVYVMSKTFFPAAKG